MDISNDNVDEMIYAADKYMLTGIKRECENVLKKIAKTEHAAKTLNIAHIYNLSNLKQESLEYIESNTKVCLSSDYALTMPKESLEIILQSDFLDCTETDICAFFLDWTKNKCHFDNLEPTGENQRKVAGELVYLIRFPVVDMKYFSSKVSKSGLITPDEIVSIYQSHFGEKCALFVNRPRGPVHKRQVYTLQRYTSVGNHWVPRAVEALCFIADTNIWIKGVVIFYPCNQMGTEIGPPLNQHNTECTFRQIWLHIMDEKETVIDTATTRIQTCESHTFSHPIYFPNATLISAGHKYTLKMTGVNYKSFFGHNCEESVTVNDVTIKFENSAIGGRTNTQTGQFGGILFSV